SRWNSGRSAVLTLASSTTSAPVASIPGRSNPPILSAETTRAPAIVAQIVAKCVLPDPSGPMSATARDGQSGHESISASAAAFPGPDKKSSRAKLSGGSRASASWRGRDTILFQAGACADIPLLFRGHYDGGLPI